jgi:thiosulfate/3-mercaptopyruvate sulfurtransferase
VRNGSGGCCATSATTTAPCWSSKPGAARSARARRRSSRRLHAATRESDTIDAGELAERLEELVVVDARRPERFRGEENPIDRVPGRVPGARNAPWDEPLPQLPEGELVAYCGSGVTACVTLHRLWLSGREGRLYPGSWSEWEQLDLPVTRG